MPTLDDARTFVGNLVVPSGARFAIVASRFNDFIVDPLIRGAFDAIVRHGGDAKNVTVVRVPGAWEIPAIVHRLAAKRGFDAIIALSAVIRGSTPHFDYVAGAASNGVGSVAASTGVPVAFGVLTTDSIEQAIERAGTKAGNKGWDAAVSAIEMVSLGRALDEAGL
ncbi:6,7-dimethyl-8-ribityllumazine synthase [Pendulispora albinea]|uniref:6,7-dimethyl-8-ribityllumazine synthase n=1 Tax=Pendulispora albinea TaxID=2741071 RepID=A0ABZ2M2W0_9BACT